MKWTEIAIKVNREAYEAVSDMLINIGSGGVAIQDPKDILEEMSLAQVSGSLDEYIDEELLMKLNSMGENTVALKSYFPESVNSVELIYLVKEKLSEISQYLNTGNIEIEYSEVKEEDWANNWKKYYSTFKISENVIIKPSWEKFEHKGNEVIIEMDPGMAFGTGTHETTRMCAKMLEKYTCRDDTVIDVGTGSGILTIIAAKLGAKKITALDIDKEAVKITIDNCSHNNVADKVTALQGVLNDLNSLEKEKKVDLIVANIIASVIIDLSGKIPEYLKPGGILLTSGIIKSRKDEVLECYEKIGFQCIEVTEDGEWVAIVFKCPDSL